MYQPQFKYVAPKTSDELSALLSEHRGKAKILSGGTDLLVALKDKEAKPDYMIDISGLQSLHDITYNEGKGLVIGAATKIAEIEQAPVIKDKFYALHQSAAAIGSPQVRAMGSIGGNSCTASPAGDTPPSLIAFGARVKLVSKRGTREMLLEDFIQGNRMTALEQDEFLESFVLEEPWPNSASRYQNMGLREAMEIDMVNVAVNVALDPNDGNISNVRIVMGAVGPTPLRARQAEDILKGQAPDDATIDKAAELCAQESQPIDDFRASGAYRREIVKVLARRALKEATAAIG